MHGLMDFGRGSQGAADFIFIFLLRGMMGNDGGIFRLNMSLDLFVLVGCIGLFFFFLSPFSLLSSFFSFRVFPSSISTANTY
jgi:hypothetical protein